MERMLTADHVREGSGGSKSICPYNSKGICVASISYLLIDQQKNAACCGSEEYDNCPLFLSKLLRRR